MKVVILAGGRGSRLGDDVEARPKPMLEVGDRPLLWHILKHYARHGIREHIIALGDRGEMIKRFFVEYRALSGDLTVGPGRGLATRGGAVEDWTVHLIDTGAETNTGGRVRRLAPWLAGETFMLTYGDGVSDVDLGRLLAFHRGHGKLATVTAVRPPARFGGLVFDGDLVREFQEKPQVGEGWVNGGFMILEPGVLELLGRDEDSLEAVALDRLASDGQLMAFRHEGFWQGVDTLRELRLLRELWKGGAAPWKTW